MTASGDDPGRGFDADGRPVMEPSSLAQFIKQDRCKRYLHQDVYGNTLADDRKYTEAYSVLSPALLGYGLTVEAGHVESLAQNAVKIIGPAIDTAAPAAPDIHIDEQWRESITERRHQVQKAVEEAASLSVSDDEDRPYILLYQPLLAGHLEEFRVAGEADVLALTPSDSDTATAGATVSGATTAGAAVSDADVEARVIEIKSADQTQAHHHVQVAIYTALLEQELDSFSGETPSVSITGSVLTDTDDVHRSTARSPFATDPIPLVEWRVTIETLLTANGPVESAVMSDVSDLGFSIGPHCTNCAYREACMTQAVEQPGDQQSLSLLGLDAADQDRLETVGITSITDLTTLGPRPTNAHPRDDPIALSLTPDQRDVLDAITGGSKHELVQRAHAVRGSIDSSAPAQDSPPPIQGKDWVPLPRDDVANWGNVESAAPGDLIHVTVTARHDPTIDRVVGLGATVTADNYGDTISLSEVIDAVPNIPAVASSAERDVFDRFLTGVYDAIETVATALGSPEESVLHVYLYSRQAYEAVVDGLDRHRDLQPARAFRSLLSLRAPGELDADQEMVSVVEPLITEHFALQAPNTGLLPVLDQFQNYPPGLLFRELPNKSVKAIQAFGHGWLEYYVPYLETGDGIRLHTGPGPFESSPVAAAAPTDTVSSDGRYPSRKREGAFPPIEYFWAVLPESIGDSTPRLTFDILDDGTLDSDARAHYKAELTKIRQCRPGTTDPLTRDDVEWVMAELSHALYRLLETIPNAVKNGYLSKTPVDATELTAMDHTDQSLPRVARDYQLIEHAARRDETQELYRRPLDERLQTGRSAIFRCTDVESTPDGGLRITGDLQSLPGQAGSHEQLRLHGNAGAGNGSWRVLTRLAKPSEERGAYDVVGVDDPVRIQHSPPVLVEAIDRAAGTITLTALPHRFTDTFSAFRVDHTGWDAPHGSNIETRDAESIYVDGRDPVWIDEGHSYVLDPMVDDLAAPKAHRALAPNTVSENTLAEQFKKIQSNSRAVPASIGSSATATAFLEEFKGMPETLSPNDDQAAVIADLNAAVIHLQGPPGAGKTGGTIGPGLLARAYAAAAADQSFIGVCVAPSHAAVDAMLDGVVAGLDEYRHQSSALDHLDLYRVRPGAVTTPMRVDTDTPNVTVEYLNYLDDADTDALVEVIEALHTPQQRLTGSQPAAVFAVTPSTLYRVLGAAATTLSEIDGESAPAAMRWSGGLADVLVVDEASMLEVPKLLLAGSALKPRGQALLVGDHRQLSAPTTHDWDTERRLSIQDSNVHQSALDYVRWLLETTGPVQSTPYVPFETAPFGVPGGSVYD